MTTHLNSVVRSKYLPHYRRLDRDFVFRLKNMSCLIDCQVPQFGGGTIWEADGHRFLEAEQLAEDYDLQTAGGVKLYATGESVSLTQFGSVAPGHANVKAVTAAWLKMIAYGKRTGAEIVVPETPPGEYWAIAATGYAYNGMKLRMDGHLKNINTDFSNGYGNHFCIMFGNVTATGFNEATAYDIAPARLGTRTVLTTDPAAAGHFAPGDVIILKSAEYELFGGEIKPNDQMMNEVQSANPATGQIILTYALRDSFAGTNPQIANMQATGVTDTLGVPQACVKDVSVYGPGGFSSECERWTGFGGCLRPDIRTFAYKTAAALSVNGFSFGSVDISGRFSSGGIEIAYFSNDLTVSSSFALHHSEEASENYTPFIVANEQARRIVFDDFEGIGTATYLPEYLSSLGGSHSCTIGCNVRLMGDANHALANISAAGASIYRGHRIVGSRYHGNAPIGLLIQPNKGMIADSEVNGLLLLGNFWHNGIRVGGRNLMIRNVYHETGNVELLANSKNFVLEGLESSLPQKILEASDANGVISARNYLRSRGISGRGQMLMFSLESDQAIAITPPMKIGKMEWISNDSDGSRGRALFNTASPKLTLASDLTSPGIAATTGILTGTTGATGVLTVSAHTNGKIYFENRTVSDITITLDIGD